MRLVRFMAAGLVVGAAVGFAWALLRPRAPHAGLYPTAGDQGGGGQVGADQVGADQAGADQVGADQGPDRPAAQPGAAV